MLLGIRMHKLWLRPLISTNNTKSHLCKLLFPTINFTTKEKKVLSFQSLAPFILQARSPTQQPSPPFAKKHEEHQITLIKPAVLHLSQSKHTPHNSWPQNKLPIHTIRNIIINQHILILCRFLHLSSWSSAPSGFHPNGFYFTSFHPTGPCIEQRGSIGRFWHCFDAKIHCWGFPQVGRSARF